MVLIRLGYVNGFLDYSIQHDIESKIKRDQVRLQITLEYWYIKQ